MTNPEYGISVEQMAATVAHEIRNPLALIRANLQMIEAEDLAPRKKSYVVIYRELDRINNLLVQMMDITKPRCSKFSAVDLTAIVEEILQDFSAVLSAREIRIHFEYTRRAVIYGDASQLKQLFINVIKNSMEALDEISGTKKILIKCTLDNSDVCATVEDNGCGIPEDQLSHTYTAFFTTKSGGNGLGLFVCRKIISEHNGCFDIRNKDTGGVIVSLKIPLLQPNGSTI